MRRRYFIPFLIAALIIMVLLKIGNIAYFEKNKSNYTKVTGVVTAKYTKTFPSSSSRRRRRSHRRRIQYLTVQYTKNGEPKTVDDLRANFWETTGDTIEFYITPDDAAFRNAIMDSNDLYTVIICIVFLVIYIRQRSLERSGSNTRRAVVGVGTVINDFDFVPDKPDDTSADDNLTDYDTTEEPRLRMPVSEKPPFELYTEEEYEKLNK